MTDLPPPPPSFGGPVFSHQPAVFDLAGWWRRAGAFVLDALLIAAVGVALIFGLAAIGGEAALVLGIVLVVVGAALYETGMLVNNNGQTVGKMATGIRVVDANSPQRGLGWGKAWGRYGAEFAFGMGFNLVSAAGAGGAFLGFVLSLLLYLWPLWDGRNQTWYDKAAGTIVIRA